MKRSEGQNQGRPTQFGTHKEQTTVRIPENVLVWLKKQYKGVLQRAIDARLIIPAIREMDEEDSRTTLDPDLLDSELFKFICERRAKLDVKDDDDA